MKVDIDVILKDLEGIVVLQFNISDKEVILNLEGDDSEEIKAVFLELSKELRKNPINLVLKIADDFDKNKNQLFIDTSDEYIKQLNKEMAELENDSDLQSIRNF